MASRAGFQKFDISKEAFSGQIERWISIISRYHSNEACQRVARSCVPWDKIQMDAMLTLSKVTAAAASDHQERSNETTTRSEMSESVAMERLLILELMDWFKKSFFQWFHAPECATCSRRCSASGTSRSGISGDEEAIRVELYKCDSCGREEKFPRHNNPMTLLETRRGRCGEWANAFLLILRSLGYESRLVLDWTDHVWCEIFSQDQDRWIHADPCEPSYDAPLLYECGWKKDLIYCVAVSEREVQDVTWRYSLKMTELLERRRPISEQWLAAYLLNKSETLQRNLDVDRRRDLSVRRVAELAQLIWTREKAARVPSKDEISGRQSGDLLWRLARQEQSLNRNVGYSIRPSGSGNFTFRYDPISDQYDISDDGGGRQTSSSIPSWRSCTWSYENIDRKVEHDWEMVYLARCEGGGGGGGGGQDLIGEICWSLNLEDCRTAPEKIEIFLAASKFDERAQITLDWCVMDETSDRIVPSSSPTEVIGSPPLESNLKLVIHSPNINKNLKYFIRVRLSGGDEDLGWQQAQLFRTKNIRNPSSSSSLFQIDIKF